MTALITALMLSLTGLPPSKSESPRPLIEIHQSNFIPDHREQKEVLPEELSMRDWKLLMPNWKPKTSAFAIVGSVQVKNSLS